MKFPYVRDIATTNVIKTDITSSLSDALDLLLDEDHRDILITDNDKYRIFSIYDVLKYQSSDIDLSLQLSEFNLRIIPTISKNANVLDTLKYLENTTEYIAVINADASLYGLITHTDITSSIDPETLLENYKLVDFLKLTSHIEKIQKETPLNTVLVNMMQKGFDSFIVIEDDKPIGLLTTKDILYILKEHKDRNAPVSEFMSSPVDTINYNSSIRYALEFIKEKHYKRIIVVDDDERLLGIIAQKELIALTYSKWVNLMKDYQDELSEINNILKNKSRDLEKKASTDALTGLYNRVKFSELYVSSYKHMVQRIDEKLSLMMIDIDFFKKINDTYGHNIGDKVLKEVSNIILKTVRNIDIVARWGGEEFLVLIPTADINIALKIAEKVRKNIESLEIDDAGNVTVSIGVSQVATDADMQENIKHADEALYNAKNSGRNCVKAY